MPVSIFEALNLIEESTQNTLSTEIIPIENALYRVSSQTLQATIALPTFNNSAMDGYGLCGEAENYEIIGKILAGDSHSYELKDTQCIKILTGARVPSSVDTIIPQENTTINEKSITIKKAVKFGANIRYKGEDISQGEDIITKGEKINSSHIALFASQGITHIEVYRKVSVGVFASGNELKLHFEQLKESQVYNSNTLYLLARSKELGAQTRFVGKSQDSVESLKELINSAQDCDVIVTSGGVSVGEADFTKESFTQLGMNTFFNKVQIKPGKPTTFGKIGDTFVLNLPGNPLASSLNFEIFGTFLLRRLSGMKNSFHGYITTKITQDITSPRPISNIIPGNYNGRTFTPIEKFAPGMVNVLNHCNGLIVIDPKTDTLAKDDLVKFLPMRWEFLESEFKDFLS